MKRRVLLFSSLFVLLLSAAIYVMETKKNPTGLSTGRWAGEEEEAAGPDEGPGGGVVVEASAPDYLAVRVSLPDTELVTVEMPDGGVYTRIAAPGSAYCEVAKPAVPAYGVPLLIPNGTEADLEVHGGEALVYEDIDLAPAQPPPADVDAEEQFVRFEKDLQAYETDAGYPGRFAELEPTRIMRGQPCTVLWLYPYQYNPVTKRLLVYPDLAATVRFLGQVQPIPPRLASDPSEAILRKLYLNADSVLSAEKEAAGNPGLQEATTSYGWDYIIITHSKFLNAANKLAQWKQKCGFKTLVVTKPAAWTAADIKTALQKAYDDWSVPPEYVLLIGDSEYIPTHYETWHPYNGIPNGGNTTTQGHTGTDLYYVTLDGTGDLLADVSIGRLSVDTAAEADRRVDGIVKYEQAPPAEKAFYDTAALCGYFQDGGNFLVSYFNKDKGKPVIETRIEPPNGIADRRFAQTSEDLAALLGDPKYQQGKSVKRIYYTAANVSPGNWNDGKQFGQDSTPFSGLAGAPGDPIPSGLLRASGFAWDGYQKNIFDAVNAGCFLLTHRDHGGRQKWSHPLLYGNNLPFLQNYDLLPVVWSVNCQTGWFDNEADFQTAAPSGFSQTDLTGAGEESLSEYLERPQYAGCGAVAVIASTRVSYSGPNDRLFLGMADAIWPGYIEPPPAGVSTGSTGYVGPGAGIENRGLGDVLRYAKEYVGSKCADDEYRKAVLEGFHLFGDPSMKMRTHLPATVTARLPDRLPWALTPGSVTLHVGLEGREESANGGSSGVPEGVKVTLSKEDSPDDHWVGEVDENGDVTFENILLSDTGTYEIVVTAPDAVPLQASLPAEAGPAGGVWLRARGSRVEVRLADADLRGAEMYDLLVFSSGGDEEYVTLREKEDRSGMFVGSIDTGRGEGAPNDRVLQVAEGEEVSVDYVDGDDGSGEAGSRRRTMTFRPEPPVFEGVNYTMLGENVVLVP